MTPASTSGGALLARMRAPEKGRNNLRRARLIRAQVRDLEPTYVAASAWEAHEDNSDGAVRLTVGDA